MKTILALALVLAAVAVSANAGPSAQAIEQLRQADQRHAEAVETGTDAISRDAAYRLEESSKSLNAPLKPATAEEIRKVVTTAEFRAAMQPGSDADIQIALMP